MSPEALDIGGFATVIARDGGYRVLMVGAASGIGKVAALRLAEIGAAVICADRNPAGADAVAREIRAAGGTAEALALDISDPASTRAALDGIAKKGALHALVNCAGITGLTNIKGSDVDLEDFDTVYRINLRGALALSQGVLPGMLARGFGRLLHVASIAGKEGNAGMAAYSASKAGLIGLVKSLAKDYAETGVTVNALAPAVIQTPMVDALNRPLHDRQDPDAPVRHARRSCGDDRMDRVAGLQLHDRFHIRPVRRTRDLLSVDRHLAASSLGVTINKTANLYKRVREEEQG